MRVRSLRIQEEEKLAEDEDERIMRQVLEMSKNEEIQRQQSIEDQVAETSAERAKNTMNSLNNQIDPMGIVNSAVKPGAMTVPIQPEQNLISLEKQNSPEKLQFLEKKIEPFAKGSSIPAQDQFQSEAVVGN